MRVKNKKVFLESLPRTYKGVDWRNSVGYTLNFVYNEMGGNIEILEHFMKNERSYLKVRYKDNIRSMQADQIVAGSIGSLLGVFTREYRFQEGETVKRGDLEKLKIRKRIRIKTKNGKTSEKGYVYECLTCGNEDEIFEYDLANGTGCNVCSGNKVLIGFNDIATTHPDIAKMMVNESDSYTYSF